MLATISAALGAAVCFATSAVLQQAAAHRVPTAKALHAALLTDLLRRRQWLLGLLAAAAGFGLQGLALQLGCLALVQPLILLDLLIALLIGAHVYRRTVQPLQWISGFAVAGGVGLLLAAARPYGGRPELPSSTFAILALAVAACVGLCAVIARFAARHTRTVVLATGAGLVFGLLAALLDNVTYLLAHHGVIGTLSTWQPYLLAVVAPIGELFAQSAYQAGPLFVSSPVLNTVEPGSAIAIGTLAFGEHIAHSPAAIALEVVAACGVVVGVIGLGRAPVVPAAGDTHLAPVPAASDTP